MIITIFGKELKTKDGKKFVKYTYTRDGNTFYNFKVSQNSPKQLANMTGYLKVSFQLNKSFIKKGKTNEKGFTDNDTIWVTELLNVEVDTEAKALADKRKQEIMQEVFTF